MTYLDKKTGDPLCDVCGHFWNDHGLGGNCFHPPRPAIVEQERESGKVVRMRPSRDQVAREATAA